MDDEGAYAEHLIRLARLDLCGWESLYSCPLCGASAWAPSLCDSVVCGCGESTMIQLPTRRRES
jgi:hypothetical protein